ncbi:cytochrome oxidase putative small subunit CydP [Pandoraea anhela]|uniref:Uncharacterized protein n=1 Tax=Pandoraea anhela TaxID=2508295 RepID=A0A5E4XJF6_9BURK|nr:cytochrome oxidase putative small subunit CydP [Pandoraea anhela]VVE36521.1 hypothetical protein PAN31108_03913 [Pandoraea anhela]
MDTHSPSSPKPLATTAAAAASSGNAPAGASGATSAAKPGSGALAWVRRRWRTRPSRFALEILIVLAIKVVLLFILKHAFFDAPMAKHMQLPPDVVARALLGPQAVEAQSPTKNQGVRHDQ